MNQSAKKRVQHSDLRINERTSDKSVGNDVRLAIDTIAAQHNISRLSVELGQRVVDLTRVDQSSRAAHHFQYRIKFDLDDDEAVVDGCHDFAEQSLIDFDERLSREIVTPKTSIWDSVGKGVSVELGHVDQFADWTVAHSLDEELRALPESDRLADAGFIFEDTYGTRVNAKIHYNFKVVDSQTGTGLSLMGIRKRAAADLSTRRGSAYQIIKRSSFLVNVADLDAKDKVSLDAIGANLQIDKRATPDVRDARRQALTNAGLDIIEPFIIDPTIRTRSRKVLAISSLYFALKRR